MILSTIKSVHFVGIKGVAMAALAIIAKEKGMKVTGSDVSEQFPTDALLSRVGININSSFSPKNLPAQIDVVVYTGAHQGIHNPEVVRANARGIPVLSHAQALGLFMNGKRTVSVAGSHGKTTTSAMIAHLLTGVGEDPSFAIGCGEILSLKTPSHAGKGVWFVAEADEYVTDPTSDLTPRFMWQKPEITVVTNIDLDHVDIYKDLTAIKNAFRIFLKSMNSDGYVIANGDHQVVKEVTQGIKAKVVTYGQSEAVDYRITDVSYQNQKTCFSLVQNKSKTYQYELSIPGIHNVYNAGAALAATIVMGISPNALVDPLKLFIGTKRRFEKIVEKNGKILIDDYAHHPVEITATLAGARKWYPDKRMIVIFQPHTYSRTQVLLSQFATCFKDADQVLITDIYASAREQPISNVSGEILASEVAKYHDSSMYASDRQAVLKYIKTHSRENDLILSMGAGDIFTWLPEMVKNL